MQFDLICNYDYLADMSQLVFGVGLLVGSVAFTRLADKIGRKPVHLGCQWGTIILGAIMAFSPNYVIFTVLRFVIGTVRAVNIFYENYIFKIIIACASHSVINITKINMQHLLLT